MAAFSDLVPQQITQISQQAIRPNEWQRIISGTHATDWILVAVGIGQFVILGVQAVIYDRQRILMDGQLKATERTAYAAIAAQRPWIRIASINLTAPIVVNHEMQAVISGALRIENIGNTPALRVFVQTTICFDFNSIEETIAPLRDESERFWDMAKGSIVFPKETFDQNVRIWARLPELPLAAVTILAGIVCYQFGEDVGTTTFAYSLNHGVLGPHFIRHLQVHPNDAIAQQSQIIIERIRFMGNDAT